MLRHQSKRFHDFDRYYSEYSSHDISVLPYSLNVYYYFAELQEIIIYLVFKGRIELLRLIVIGKVVLFIHVETIENQTNVCDCIMEHVEHLMSLFTFLKSSKQSFHEKTEFFL